MDENELRLTLARSIKSDMLDGLPPALLMLLNQYRPHQEQTP